MACEDVVQGEVVVVNDIAAGEPVERRVLGQDARKQRLHLEHLVHGAQHQHRGHHLDVDIEAPIFPPQHARIPQQLLQPLPLLMLIELHAHLQFWAALERLGPTLAIDAEPRQPVDRKQGADGPVVLFVPSEPRGDVGVAFLRLGEQGRVKLELRKGTPHVDVKIEQAITAASAHAGRGKRMGGRPSRIGEHAARPRLAWIGCERCSRGACGICRRKTHLGSRIRLAARTAASQSGS
eukprot:scaffold23343_cov129-Isochrysis_galbana.AAC.4